MKNSLFYFLLLVVAIANAQKNEFKNQGEQENALAEQFFEKKYVRQNFEKFQGKITVIDKTNITFNNKTLQFWNIKPELLQVFTEGIFYPQIVLGNEENNIIKTQSELLSEKEAVLYNLKRNDKLKISNFEELVSLSKSPKVKRFRFLRYSFALMNPQVYFIELTNENATENTDLNSFIKDSKLTFVELGWLTT